MIVIELRKDNNVLTTEKVHNIRYLHAYAADVFAYARAYGFTPGIDCEVVVTSNVHVEERKLTDMIKE